MLKIKTFLSSERDEEAEMNLEKKPRADLCEIEELSYRSSNATLHAWQNN